MSNVGLGTNIRNEFAFISRFGTSAGRFFGIEERGRRCPRQPVPLRVPSMAAIGNRRVAERNSFQARKKR
jgi:hypothetical protein